MSKLPSDYWERVYAAVLGKLIGVYLGRPFEGWSYERIQERLGDIEYYVADQLGMALVVTDDDITGTFTFIRALHDAGNRPDITAAEIGQAWLNYIIEDRTILWWGGLGNSAEHTAYLRLKSGIDAPRSGSEALNGTLISGEIGAEIFIDGWAMVAPGDPELAASLAGRAASVSHDGIAVDAARALAAMEALAFVERSVPAIVDAGRTFLPPGSRLIDVIDGLKDLRKQGVDWRSAREWLAAEHGYSKFPGNVPIIPNHGVVVLSLLFGDGDFDRTMSIVNTCGWDTDCNSGNVGCFMGILGGIESLSGVHDWRGPVRDRLYLPTADGGRAITDALTESLHIANSGRALHGLDPIRPKRGARFHFELPGAVQGFDASADEDVTASVENVPGRSQLGTRSLALRWTAPEGGASRSVRAGVATFVPADAPNMRTYELLASPTLHPCQRLWARVSLDEGPNEAVPLRVHLYIRAYGPNDELTQHNGPDVVLGEVGAELSWPVPELDGAPIAEVGIELVSSDGHGAVYLDALGWEGSPVTVLRRPEWDGSMWKRAWIDAVDLWEPRWTQAFRIIQNRGEGLISQGTADWQDYQVSAVLTPQLCKTAGLAARVTGLRRHYALALDRDGGLQLRRVAGEDVMLASRPCAWNYGEAHEFRLDVRGARIRAWFDGDLMFDVVDAAPLLRGGVGLLVAEGRLDCEAVAIGPSAEE